MSDTEPPDAAGRRQARSGRRAHARGVGPGGGREHGRPARRSRARRRRRPRAPAPPHLGVGARRAGVDPDPGLGDLGVGDPHRDRHRPVRRDHGALWRATRSSWTTWRRGRPTRCSRRTSCRTRSRTPCRRRRSRSWRRSSTRCTPTSTAWRSRSSRARSSAQLWDTLNRHSHDAVINILTGKQTPLQKKLAKGGQIALNLSPALNNLIAPGQRPRRDAVQPAQVDLEPEGLSFTVVSKQQVSKFSGLFNLIVKLKWAIPIIALVLAILSVVLAMERRKTLLRLAIGVALMTMLMLAGLSLGRVTFLDQAAGGGFNTRGGRPPSGTRVLRFLKTDLRWTLLVSVLVALGAWLAGPARYAVWIRATVAKGARWVARPGPRALVGRRAGRRRIGPGPPLRRLDRGAPQRPAHRRRGRGGALPRLRRQPHGVEPAGHRDRAGRVSRAAAAGGGVGPQGGRGTPTAASGTVPRPMAGPASVPTRQNMTLCPWSRRARVRRLARES